jgi:hypothetical protein
MLAHNESVTPGRAYAVTHITLAGAPSIWLAPAVASHAERYTRQCAADDEPRGIHAPGREQGSGSHRNDT